MLVIFGALGPRLSLYLATSKVEAIPRDVVSLFECFFAANVDGEEYSHRLVGFVLIGGVANVYVLEDLREFRADDVLHRGIVSMAYNFLYDLITSSFGETVMCSQLLRTVLVDGLVDHFLELLGHRSCHCARRV